MKSKTVRLYGWVDCKKGGCKLQFGKTCKSSYVHGCLNEWAYSPIVKPSDDMIGHVVTLTYEGYHVTDISM